MTQLDSATGTAPASSRGCHPRVWASSLEAGALLGVPGATCQDAVEPGGARGWASWPSSLLAGPGWRWSSLVRGPWSPAWERAPPGPPGAEPEASAGFGGGGWWRPARGPLGAVASPLVSWRSGRQGQGCPLPLLRTGILLEGLPRNLLSTTTISRVGFQPLPNKIHDTAEDQRVSQRGSLAGPALGPG